ncbi:acyl-homoserine-lactone synthase [Tautonia sp. JC769]|uniref:acyl-homoserine-lactone synthase n=1 Tax=Tautonia sp. JC769 TaxID=3232135 RepID=UPI00345A284F
MQIVGFSELSCTPLYPRYLEFRNDVFNQLLKYHHTGNPVFQFTAFDASERLGTPYGVEYDQYDIPKTLHLAFVDAHGPLRKTPRSAADRDGAILGCLRFLPTDGPYMIRDAVSSGTWENVELLVDDLPGSPAIYEASRIAVSPRVKDAARRKAIVDSLVYANVEIGVRLGVERMIGIMYDRVWNSVYRERGVPIRYLSKPFRVDDGPPIIIGEIDTSAVTLAGLAGRYSREIEAGLIVPAAIESATWMMHFYHVNRSMPSLPPAWETRAPSRPGIREAVGG